MIPYEQTLRESLEYFGAVQQTIDHLVETEAPLQQSGLEMFQREQLKLYEAKHGKNNRFGTFLNSVYTPEPIYVPEVSYLFSLSGSCHPLVVESGANNDNTTNNNNNNAYNTPTNGNTTTNTDTTNNQNQVCQPCTLDLVSKYPSLVSKDFCAMIPYISIYQCDDNEAQGDLSDDNNNNDSNNTDTAKVLHVVPCVSAYVDGRQQFWALFTISAILILASGILVRRRLDKAQAKVFSKLVKPNGTAIR